MRRNAIHTSRQLSGDRSASGSRSATSRPARRTCARLGARPAVCGPARTAGSGPTRPDEALVRHRRVALLIGGVTDRPCSAVQLPRLGVGEVGPPADPRTPPGVVGRSFVPAREVEVHLCRPRGGRASRPTPRPPPALQVPGRADASMLGTFDVAVASRHRGAAISRRTPHRHSIPEMDSATTARNLHRRRLKPACRRSG